MHTIFGGRLIASVCASLVLAVSAAACGGGGSDMDHVAVLEVRPSDAHEQILLDAVNERGAPGENEPVRYRVRAGSLEAAQAAVAALRAHGFSDVDLE